MFDINNNNIELVNLNTINRQLLTVKVISKKRYEQLKEYLNWTKTAFTSISICVITFFLIVIKLFHKPYNAVLIYGTLVVFLITYTGIILWYLFERKKVMKKIRNYEENNRQQARAV